MSVTDRQVERYGADASRADLQPCFNDATDGITAGDCTQHLCLEHVAPTLRVRTGAPCRLASRTHRRLLKKRSVTRYLAVWRSNEMIDSCRVSRV
jgi:hypothetical protein